MEFFPLERARHAVRGEYEFEDNFITNTNTSLLAYLLVLAGPTSNVSSGCVIGTMIGAAKSNATIY